jgi:hypothetical protein
MWRWMLERPRLRQAPTVRRCLCYLPHQANTIAGLDARATVVVQPASTPHTLRRNQLALGSVLVTVLFTF